MLGKLYLDYISQAPQMYLNLTSLLIGNPLSSPIL